MVNKEIIKIIITVMEIIIREMITTIILTKTCNN